MFPGEEEISCQVETIWSSMLGLTVVRNDGAVVPTGNEGFVTGCIQITGAWEGAVTLVCDKRLARRAASIMFSLHEDELTGDLIHDALGELTNMTGGNLKALLPEPCYLCLPAVVEGTEYLLRVLKVKPTCAAWFRCWNLPFVVSVFERYIPVSKLEFAAR
jgi:chemotaxis protein CheX